MKGDMAVVRAHESAPAVESRPPDADSDRSSRRVLSAFGVPVLGVLAAIVLWWSITAVFHIRPYFVPSPWDIAVSFRDSAGYLLTEMKVTVEETLVGFAIGGIAGLVISIVLAASRTIERATVPLLVALNSVPKVAIAPLLTVWLGFGFQPKVLMVILICFFPVVVSTMSGLISTPSELSELAKSLSANWWQTYLKVRLRWALPQIFVGVKVATSLAVIGAVVAEIGSPQHGLGAVIVLSGSSADTPLAFAAITLLALLSVALFYLVVGLERWLLPWARAISG
jgi:NitT/TauT family transport system permease protein